MTIHPSALPTPALSTPALPTPARASWQRQLRDAVRDVAELAALLDLPVEAIAPARSGRAGYVDGVDGVAGVESVESVEAIETVEAVASVEGVVHEKPAAPDFPLLVPRAYVARIRKRDPRDPLLLQILPTALESLDVPGFTADPLDESEFAAGGVVRKYRGRSLLITTGACPVHCRYCFRRAFPYADQLAARGDFAAALEQLAEDGTSEVILSGGDPLCLGNDRLASLLERLDALPALRRVRLHTRFPIVLPDRVDAGLAALLERTRLGRVIVLHANHPREIDADVAGALAALRAAGVTLLNQAVLLRGVNDDADTLAELGERLFECGVLPYYLHLLDPVAGAAHFDVDEPRAAALHRELLGRLPGYLVPRLVREIPGRASKTPIRSGL